MKTLLLFVLFFAGTSCTTIVRRHLSVKKPGISTKNKLSLLISSPRTKHILEPAILMEYLDSLGSFSKVSVVEEYSFVTKEEASAYDVHLEVDFVQSGYFHPYCLLTLTILPCTPPIDWMYGAKVIGKPGSMEKTYLFKEKAMQITWAFGPLFPSFGREEVKTHELKINLLNNLLSKLSEDKIL